MSFSWVIASRYLSPVRSIFSSLSALAVIGVSLGVMILFVVTAVMTGFEDEMKQRILSFTPHALLNEYWIDENQGISQEQLLKQIEQTDKVDSVYPYIETFALARSMGDKYPIYFRGVDFSNEKQNATLATLLDPDIPNNNTYNPNLGLNQAIISSKLARNLSVSVGSYIELLSWTHFEKLEPYYATVSLDPLWLTAQTPIKEIKKQLQSQSKIVSQQLLLPLELLKSSYTQLIDIYTQPAREAELAIILELLKLINSGKNGAQADTKYFATSFFEQYNQLTQQLATLDIEQADLDKFKTIKQLALPTKVHITGIYRSSEHIQGPELMLPIDLAYELQSQNNTVKQWAIQVEDAYEVVETLSPINQQLPQGYVIQTWSELYQWWFNLVAREKTMMNLVLSLITIGAAFSMAAILFLQSMQKKREIGIMLALGAKPTQIMSIFWIQAIIIGIIGLALGLALGYLVIDQRDQVESLLSSVGLDPFPQEFHGVSSIPAKIEQSSVVFVTLLSLISCLLAPILPAIISLNKTPSQTLRDF